MLTPVAMADSFSDSFGVMGDIPKSRDMGQIMSNHHTLVPAKNLDNIDPNGWKPFQNLFPAVFHFLDLVFGYGAAEWCSRISQ